MKSMNLIEAESILGLSRPYDASDLSKAYRKAVKENHPDLGGSPEKMVDVNAAKSAIERFLRAGGDTSAPQPQSQPRVNREPRANANARSQAETRSSASARANTQARSDEEAWERAYAREQARKQARAQAEATIDDAVAAVAESMAEEQVDDASERVAAAAADEEAAKAKASFSYAPGWLYWLFRIAVFSLFFFPSISAMQNGFGDMGEALDNLFSFVIYAGIGVACSGWIARMLLRLFGMAVTDKDADAIVAKAKRKYRSKRR